MLIGRRILLTLVVLTTIMSNMSTAKTVGEETLPYTGISMRQLLHRIDSLIQAYQIPGVGIALVSKDSVIWAGGVGVANIASGKPVDGETLFRMASISKSFLGFGFQKLVEESRIDLHTPISVLIPEVSFNNPWNDTDPVQVVHLLEHTAGFDESHFYEFVNLTKDPNIPLLEILNISPTTRNVRWQPGTRMSYSNHGYLLAGYVMERVTGERFEDYLTRVLLRPIGMTGSAFRLADIDSRLLAQGYDDDLSEYPLLINLSRPASNLVSSPDDMARFVQCLLNRGMIDGQAVLAPESIDRAETASTSLAAQAGLVEGYGLGIESKYCRGHLSFGHGGDIGGFSSKYAYIPQLGIGCVVMANRLEGHGVTEVLDACLDYLIGPAEVLQPSTVTIDPSTLYHYEGYYGFQSSRSEFTAFLDVLLSGLTLFVERDTLWMSTFFGEAEALLPVDDTKFRTKTVPIATFALVNDQSGNMILTDSSGFYERGSYWFALLRLVMLIGAIIIAASTIAYAIYWIPVTLFHRLCRKRPFPPYMRIRILPFAAVISLIAGIVAFESESTLSLLTAGFCTTGMILFYISTLAFAGFSLLSIVYSGLSITKAVGTATRWYAIVVSIALFGLSVYLWSSGVIGFRAWSY